MSHVCAYRVEFYDGGEPEFGLLCVGTEDECNRTMEAVPAVAYGGPRPIKGCRIGVFEAGPVAPERTNVAPPVAAPGGSVSGTGLPE